MHGRKQARPGERMRILLINSEYPPVGGGAGNASANIARELVSLGQDVVVLTARFDHLPVDETQQGVRIHRVASLRRRADRSGAFEQLAFILSGTLAASSLARHWRPDAILAFFGAPAGVVALGLRAMLHLPYVVSLRGGDVPGFRPYDFRRYHQMIGPLLHLVWRNASAVVANSDGLRALAMTFDPEVPIPVVHNGVDTSRFLSGDRQWEPARLLLVGRIVHQKGIDLLLEALAGLRALSWELLIVGDGPRRETYTAQAAAAGLQGRVRFAGWLTGEALEQAYARANLFVFPSRHEGMPNVVLEAMSSGLPVVASRVAGNEELIDPGVTGLLVPKEDASALREAVRALIGDPAARRAMGQAARRRAETAFTWRAAAEQYLQILRTAVA
jgi:glycosyltransferase involved in cell wall biosynthesis